jgi:hypothetical protein
VSQAELLALANNGLVDVVPSATPEEVVVTSAINEVVRIPGIEFPPDEGVRVHCPGWEGTYVHIGLQGENEMMVSFDGAPPMPYLVREIHVDAGARLVLSPVEVFDVIDPNEQVPLPPQIPTPQNPALQVELPSLTLQFPQLAPELVTTITNAIAEGRDPFVALAREHPELAGLEEIPMEPVRRLSHWERLAQMKRGLVRTPGGTGVNDQALDPDSNPRADGVK